MYLSRIQLRFNNLRPEMLKNGIQPGLMPAISGYGSSFQNRTRVRFCFGKSREGVFYAFGYTAISGAFLVSH